MNTVFNPGAVRLRDGTTLLLVRVEDRRGHSHLCAARSRNGVDGWIIDPEPTLFPQPAEHPEELWGIEDPRITFVPELDLYAVVYTAYARGGPAVSLALTEDFRTFERYGVKALSVLLDALRVFTASEGPQDERLDPALPRELNQRLAATDRESPDDYQRTSTSSPRNRDAAGSNSGSSESVSR